MGTVDWSRVEDLFQRALEVPAEERDDFVAREAAGDRDLIDEVRALLAADATPDVFLTPPSARTLNAVVPAGGHDRPRPGTRLGAYVLLEEIATGGMGTVWRGARADDEFERVVAIKLLRPARDPGSVVQRFRLERRTLARLDHANIARLLDGGATDEGMPYLVMEHVDGVPIDAFCDARRLGVRERLELFCPVAAAVHHAHRSFVVHRDLKPGNILVTRDGVPKLVDFGIAKILDEDESDPGGPALTRTGVRPMTPRYASPEQVRGDAITTASDVYSLGVVLYEILCGVPPHARDGQSEREFESAILESEPPKPSTTTTLSTAEIASARSTTPTRLRRELAGDLDTIVLTALRKEPDRRYSSAEQMGEDVRRLLDGQPIRARRDTWRYRTAKFVGRHKVGTAFGLAAGIALVVSLAAFLRSAHVAETRLEEVLRLSNLARLDDFAKAADALWPAVPDKIPAIERWMAAARELAANADRHRDSLAELRQRAERRGEAFVFPDVETQWQHDKTAELVERLAAFSDPQTGSIADVERRLAFARDVRRLSIDERAAEWDEARSSIANASECPSYAGLQLAPQLGLVPLGLDPASGLFEFAHLATGTVPGRGADGQLQFDEDSGIVLVLIPGGRFEMGARQPGPDDPAVGPNLDLNAVEKEGPVHAVELSPYFLSKFEMTQGQWLRATGANPSVIAAGTRHGSVPITLRDPVESVSWTECDRTLTRLGLTLPTEAQWERAARAGTTTPWWSGEERESLRGAANLADQSAARAGAPWVEIRDWPDLDDGHVVHASVDAFRPNPYGLHNVCGNVWEWCLDHYGAYTHPTRAGDGLRTLEGQSMRVGRGGGFTKTAAISRHSNRGPAAAFYRDESIGVRPARAIDG